MSILTVALKLPHARNYAKLKWANSTTLIAGSESEVVAKFEQTLSRKQQELILALVMAGLACGYRDAMNDMRSFISEKSA